MITSEEDIERLITKNPEALRNIIIGILKEENVPLRASEILAKILRREPSRRLSTKFGTFLRSMVREGILVEKGGVGRRFYSLNKEFLETKELEDSISKEKDKQGPKIFLEKLDEYELISKVNDRTIKVIYDYNSAAIRIEVYKSGKKIAELLV